MWTSNNGNLGLVMAMTVEDEELAQAAVRLDNNPLSRDAVEAYWRLLGPRRSGLELMRAFRRWALVSREGVCAMAAAYRDLWLTTGEGPRSSYIDPALLQRLADEEKSVDGQQADDIRWVLSGLGEEGVEPQEQKP